MKKPPLVSIITINFNRLLDTVELINSIQKINYSNTELILVDNGSDECLDLIQYKFQDVTLIKNEKNLGFAAANNIGIRRAKGKYILLINNDVIVTRDFLEPLVQKLELDEQVGIVSPKIYYHGLPQIIQYAGFTDIHPITIRNKGIGFNEPESRKYDVEKETCYAHGAAFLFRSKIIEKAGYMNEIFFCTMKKWIGVNVYGIMVIKFTTSHNQLFIIRFSHHGCKYSAKNLLS